MFKAEIRGVLTGFGAVGLVLLVAISAGSVIPGQELLGSLRFHIGIALLGLAIALVLTGARWRAAVMGATICASLGQGALVMATQLSARAQMADQTPLAQFKLLSFNVLATNPRGADIAAYMVKTLPDVAVIMETPGIQSQIGALSATFPYHAGCANPTTCDLSLFSRTPLRDVKVIKSWTFQRERLIVAKTTIKGQDVTLVAIHLSKPYFDESAWVELRQAGYLLQGIEGPIVLTGDFNAAAWSGNVADFVAHNGLVPPPRFPATWPVRLGPLGVPIDNMFSRDGALIESIDALDSSIGSNHRGLLAQIAIVPQAAAIPAP